MMRLERLEGTAPDSWDEIIAHLPGAHVLQTREWGLFKQGYGWQPQYFVWRSETGGVNAAAQVLGRAAPGGWKVLYVPRGPLVDWSDEAACAQVLDDLQSLARQRGVIFFKMDPEIITGWGVPSSADFQENPVGKRLLNAMQRRGWQLSPDQVQFRNTVWLDLTGNEEDWLARMKQKTRYNIRLAERKGVTVRLGQQEDLKLLYQMYAETSVRDGFVIRPEKYYLTLWQSFMSKGMAVPLLAEVEHEVVAAVFLFYFAGRAWYLYGMSRAAHREKMPNYLLQFEAMRLAKEKGCLNYDLWGAPDVFDENDSMWGVFRFKEGLGGKVVHTAGALDYSARSWIYTLYTRVLPRILDWMRRRGKARTQAQVQQL